MLRPRTPTLCPTGESADESEDVTTSDADLEFDGECDMAANDGIQMPEDVEQKHFEDEGHGYYDQEEASCSSSDELEDYEGEFSDCEEVEGLPGCGALPEGGSSSSQQGHQKMYHVSAEWLQLKQHGEHLLQLPQVVGAGVNRHPAGKFWSARYPGQQIKTASWNDNRTPLKCLILCLKHVIKLHVDIRKPLDADSWRAQLDDLSQIK